MDSKQNIDEFLDSILEEFDHPPIATAEINSNHVEISSSSKESVTIQEDFNALITDLQKDNFFSRSDTDLRPQGKCCSLPNWLNLSD
jgi:hypothetical protein